MWTYWTTLSTLSLALVLTSSGCGDDVITSETSTESTTSGDGDGETGDGDTGDGDTGDGDTGDGDTGDGGDGDGDGDTGDGDGDGDTGDGDGDTGDGDGDQCMPFTDDPSEIHNDCRFDMCGPGYTCKGFNGFLFTLTCQILCAEDCECPDGLTCRVVKDNINQWMECHH
jgi:hypothetical protein